MEEKEMRDHEENERRQKKYNEEMIFWLQAIFIVLMGILTFLILKAMMR